MYRAMQDDIDVESRTLVKPVFTSRGEGERKKERHPSRQSSEQHATELERKKLVTKS